MEKFLTFLNKLGQKLSGFWKYFMMGRYGTDKMNLAILGAGFFLCVAAMLVPLPFLDLILTVSSYICMVWAIFRMFSRNTYKRYRENKKYLQLVDRFKDREHRYFECPRCHQTVRVPRNKGKISITCPKCKEQFIKKT